MSRGWVEMRGMGPVFDGGPREPVSLPLDKRSHHRHSLAQVRFVGEIYSMHNTRIYHTL